MSDRPGVVGDSGRFGDFLRSTLSCWRSVRISASSDALDRNRPMTAQQISLRTSAMGGSTHPLLAVIEPVSPDRRPTWLAIGLGIGFLFVLLVPPFRTFFNLYPLGPRDVAIVVLALAGWVALVWISWRGRFVDRFLGIAPPAPVDGPATAVAVVARPDGAPEADTPEVDGTPEADGASES